MVSGWLNPPRKGYLGLRKDGFSLFQRNLELVRTTFWPIRSRAVNVLCTHESYLLMVFQTVLKAKIKVWY